MFRPLALTRRRVLGAAGAAGAVAAGGAALSIAATGQAEPAPSCEPDPARPKQQLRASWIATTVNIDWPSKPGLDAATQQEEYVRFLEDAETYALNAIITQVRPTADAFWPSPHEPWSRWLTGEQGGDPGYDPLDFAVKATRDAGLEFHAWLNPYRISMKADAGDVGDDPSKLHKDHPARKHPEWVVAYGGQLYYNPGLPEVREFVIEAMMHAVDNYDIDGVHFDDYFYPYPVDDAGDFDDDDSFAEHGGDFDDKGDWRRHNTDELIKEFSRRIKESKPWVRFGVSPFGVWRNKADDPDGSDTEAGVGTYDDLYADTRKWVKEGWIDYIAPQIYWTMSMEAASYKVLTKWWDEVCADTDCHLYIGEATYKVGVDEASPEWKEDPAELSNHLALCQEHPSVTGNIYYSAKSVREDKLDAMTLLRDEHYKKPALLPAAEALGGQAPQAPEVTEFTHDGEYSVTWKSADRGDGVDEVRWYAVYALPDEPDECSFADATHLIAVRPALSDGDAQEYRWKGEADPKMRVAVAAVNRVWLEGEPAVAELS